MTNLKELLGNYWTKVKPDPIMETILEGHQLVNDQLISDYAHLRRQLVDKNDEHRHIAIYPIILLESQEVNNEWPLQDNIVKVEAICYGINKTNPTLIPDIDFRITNKKLWFRDNPFNTTDSNTICNFMGDIVDREIVLWGHSCYIDEQINGYYWGCLLRDN